ncbi:hypothetical protein HDU76_003033 [Blyttiomyces sp. JEL0837]|nr:hypothetical protein HDU76_003033 [Blyttiomyces sp. JEL0837]
MANYIKIDQQQWDQIQAMMTLESLFRTMDFLILLQGQSRLATLKPLIGARFVSSMPANEPVSYFQGKLVVSQSQAWVALACIATLILWFTAAGSAIFWVACFVITAVGLHAGFMEKSIESDFANSEV